MHALFMLQVINSYIVTMYILHDFSIVQTSMGCPSCRACMIVAFIPIAMYINLGIRTSVTKLTNRPEG